MPTNPTPFNVIDIDFAHHQFTGQIMIFAQHVTWKGIMIFYILIRNPFQIVLTFGSGFMNRHVVGHPQTSRGHGATRHSDNTLVNKDIYTWTRRASVVFRAADRGSAQIIRNRGTPGILSVRVRDSSSWSYYSRFTLLLLLFVVATIKQTS